MVCNGKCRRIIKSEILPKAIQIFKEAGYGLSQVVLDASLCGVPQKRKKYFMIGEIRWSRRLFRRFLLRDVSEKRMTVGII